MLETKVGTCVVRKQECDVYAQATTHGGRWEIRNGDTVLAQDTDFERAKRKAAVEMRKSEVTVEVPFRDREGARGVATKISLKTRQALATIEGVASEVGSGGHDHYRTPTFSPLTPDDVFASLHFAEAKIKETQNVIREIERAWGYDVVAGVKAAVDLKLAEQADDA